MAKTKKQYKDTKDPNDITLIDYMYSILYSKEKLPYTKKYNYFMINNMLAYDFINVIHANEACKRNLKNEVHYDYMLAVVEKRSGIKMSDVKLSKTISKEEKVARYMLCSNMQISMKEFELYLSMLDPEETNELMKNFMKEYKKEIKKEIDAKTY